MDYWNEKEKYKEKARLHTEEMAKTRYREIAECVENSTIYGVPDVIPNTTVTANKPNYYFLNTDSVSALKMSRNPKKAVLNFASYKNPGGRFIDGSKAQEEMLCHESFLYNVLREFPQYYKWNNEHKNRALYTDRAIFSPDVLFGDTKCSVITCAAPNFGTAEKCGVKKSENVPVLTNRLVFIRNIAETHNIETLILGAFGCGVFKQDPNTVANAIKAAFKTTTVKNIVIAVPGKDKNYEVFKRNFE